ncbi:acyltransferase 3 [Achlya hypogyna]|uniref:Acyltransferase 3 n=1 Tax=Achlya hypogyna TaxID=1202772 RepID=A0A1V9YUC4_ACHHY|nr:acyltransferase 3 [Achlya hypogyna]
MTSTVRMTGALDPTYVPMSQDEAAVPRAETPTPEAPVDEAFLAAKLEVASTPLTAHLAYRADIDGLRTVAIIPVLIFHAYPLAFPSGFIGVDIFFVISGFLISSILFKEMATQKFTYANFYSRRIRRIYPVLLVVLATTFGLGCAYHLAAPLKRLAATMLAGTLFGANLQVLSLEEGYFSASVKEDALLHLWSLGVEEQFYIFWPVLLSLLVKLSTATALKAQVAVCLVSFVTNICFLGYHGTDKYAFYLPFTRFWQMAIGGVVAHWTMHHSPAHSPWRDGLLAFVAVAMLGIAFCLLTESSAFPGYWALLPTLGAALLIGSGPATAFHAYVLSNRPMVFVGKISYALYLWHWPLLVFAKAHYPEVSTRPWYMAPWAMIAAAFILSYLSFLIVESPLRRLKSKWLVPSLVVSMLVMTALATSTYVAPASFSRTQIALDEMLRETANTPVISNKNGPNSSRGPQEAPPTYLKIMAGKGDWDPDVGYEDYPVSSPFKPTPLHDKMLNPGQKNVLFVMGDSHADMIKPRFHQLFLDSGNASFPTVMFKSESAITSLPCNPDVFDNNLALVKELMPKAFLHVTNWPQFLRAPLKSSGPVRYPPVCCRPGYQDECPLQYGADVTENLRLFTKAMKELSEAGIKVYVAGMNPEGDEFDPEKMVRGSDVGTTTPVSRAAYRSEHRELLAQVEAAIAAANATLIDFSENQCDGDSCHVVDQFGNPIMKDSNHFRPGYARKYLGVLDQMIAAATV